MRSPASLLIATLMLAGTAGVPAAQTIPPIPISALPHLAIISPVFYWDGKVDVVRTVSATCPNGRPIVGGLSIQKGNAALRIRESYPDAASWVIRVTNHHSPVAAQPLQVRAFAVCLLPVARGGSVQIAQYPSLLHLSHGFALAGGDVTKAERQACAQNTLVVSGGFGLDPKFAGPSFVRMELSYPDHWAWNVRAVNGADKAQAPAEARVYSICLGADGGMSIRNYQTVEYVEATVRVKPGDGTVRQSVACGDASARAIGGGARLIRGRNTSIEMQESFPDTPGSWTVAMANRSPGGAGDATVKLYAVCIKP